jgi:Fur family peroxide stress response transcriptional regulator
MTEKLSKEMLEHFEAETEKTLNRSGYRLTRQRREVLDALMEITDQHPTASEVFMHVKAQSPTISLATVYNTLEKFSECAVIKQVNVEREPTRYCANLQEHAHFFCTDCGKVIDAPVHDPRKLTESWSLPDGTRVTSHEVVMHGVCPECNRKAQA